MEQHLFRVYVRTMSAWCRLFSPARRRLLEKSMLLFGVTSAVLLGILHHTHVSSRNEECLIPEEMFRDSNFIRLCLLPPLEPTTTCSVESLVWREADKQRCSTRGYVISSERGLLDLSEEILAKGFLQEYYLELSAESPCLGPHPLLRFLTRTLLGPDTVIVNLAVRSIERLSSDRWEAPALLMRSGNIKPLPSPASAQLRAGGWKTESVFKGGAVVGTMLLFLTLSSLVAFTLRETQTRMLRFTALLHTQVARRAPIASLISRHTSESLVFVPIMGGTLFFLREFYGGDGLLAFCVFSIVWTAEVYSVVTIRTAPTAQLFPRVFFLYFLLLHGYIFCYPVRGFIYIALLALVYLTFHIMMYCWNNYEVPALSSGAVNALRPRCPSLMVAIMDDVEVEIEQMDEPPPREDVRPVRSDQQNSLTPLQHIIVALEGNSPLPTDEDEGIGRLACDRHVQLSRHIQEQLMDGVRRTVSGESFSRITSINSIQQPPATNERLAIVTSESRPADGGAIRRETSVNDFGYHHNDYTVLGYGLLDD